MIQDMRLLPIFGPIILVASLCVAPILAAPLDWEGDGVSDPTVVQSDLLNWLTVKGDSQLELAVGFGTSASILAPADYFGLGSAQPAYIERGGIWHVLNGTDNTFQHGAARASYLAGADVDGDGRADAIYYTKSCENRPARYYVLRDVFGTPQNSTFMGGGGNQYTTFGDVDGNGTDEICWLKPGRSGLHLTGRFALTCKDALTGLRVKRFQVGRVFGQPLALKRAEGEPVYFAFPRFNRGKTWVKVIDVHGQAVVREISFLGQGSLVAFNSSATAPQLLGFAAAGTLSLHDIDTGQHSTLPLPEGRPVSGFNTGYFGIPLDDCQCTSRKIADNGYCPSFGRLCKTYRPLHDGPGGFEHNPEANIYPGFVDFLPSAVRATQCFYENIRGELISNTLYSGRSSDRRQVFHSYYIDSCTFMPSPYTLVCISGGNRVCWAITNACQYYD